MILSATRKNTAAITTKMKTMLVVIMVSRRVGQVTLLTSARTSRTNSTGFFDMLALFRWQEWRDSNPRPSVLETDALPTELHSCSPVLIALLYDLGDAPPADGPP